jgi:hypothetical protein
MNCGNPVDTQQDPHAQKAHADRQNDPVRRRDGYITLVEASKLTPGRPSTNCMWRWCRKGVKSRNGERIRIKHVRMGGKIYTTAGWIAEFGKRLADSDAEYFDRDRPAPPAYRRRHRKRSDTQRMADIRRAEAELKAAGL